MPRPSRVYAGDEAKMQLQAGIDSSNIDFNGVERIDHIPPLWAAKRAGFCKNVSKPLPVLPVLAMSTASQGQVQVACVVAVALWNPRFMACLRWANVVSGICARVRHQLSRFNGYARVFATGERTNCIAAKQVCVCVCASGSSCLHLFSLNFAPCFRSICWHHGGLACMRQNLTFSRF